MANMTSCKSNNTNQIDMDTIRTDSLFILEETEDYIKYLAHLERIIQKPKIEQQLSVDDDELFLRYEIWTMMKKGKKSSYQECGMLHCIPERIATEEGESYDDAAIYFSREITTNNDNGNLTKSDSKASIEWTYVGLYSENGIYSKINNYFYQNKETIPVVQEVDR